MMQEDGKIIYTQANRKYCVVEGRRVHVIACEMWIAARYEDFVDTGKRAVL